MPDFGKFADKAKEMAGEHPDQVQEGLQKVGDEVDQKTGDRFSGQIQQGEQRAEGYLGDDNQNQNQ
jgi:hypothetical protein